MLTNLKSPRTEGSFLEIFLSHPTDLNHKAECVRAHEAVEVPGHCGLEESAACRQSC